MHGDLYNGNKTGLRRLVHRYAGYRCRLVIPVQGPIVTSKTGSERKCRIAGKDAVLFTGEFPCLFLAVIKKSGESSARAAFGAEEWFISFFFDPKNVDGSKLLAGVGVFSENALHRYFNVPETISIVTGQVKRNGR